MKKPLHPQQKGTTLAVVSRPQEPIRPTQLLNPKREELTPETLKSFPGYENLSDEESVAKCGAIKVFARLLLSHLATVENAACIDNQQIISLNGIETATVIPMQPKQSKPKAA